MRFYASFYHFFIDSSAQVKPKVCGIVPCGTFAGAARVGGASPLGCPRAVSRFVNINLCSLLTIARMQAESVSGGAGGVLAARLRSPLPCGGGVSQGHPLGGGLQPHPQTGERPIVSERPLKGWALLPASRREAWRERERSSPFVVTEAGR